MVSTEARYIVRVMDATGLNGGAPLYYTGAGLTPNRDHAYRFAHRYAAAYCATAINQNPINQATYRPGYVATFEPA